MGEPVRPQDVRGNWLQVRMHLAALRARWDAAAPGVGFGTAPFGTSPFGGGGFGRRTVAREWPPPFIGEVATQLAYRVSPRPPVDVMTLCRDLGITVGVAGLPQGHSGDWVGGQRPTIRIAITDTFPNQRFTAAHALGHMLLHTVPTRPQAMGLNPDVVAADGSTESEANFFGTSLLVPRPMVESLLSANLPADQLVSMFQVPPLRVQLQLAVLMGGAPRGW